MNNQKLWKILPYILVFSGAALDYVSTVTGESTGKLIEGNPNFIPFVSVLLLFPIIFFWQKLSLKIVSKTIIAWSILLSFIGAIHNVNLIIKVGYV